MSPLERNVNRGILKHAVGAVMFCPVKPAGSVGSHTACGKVLDARTAVAVFRDNRPIVVGCAECVDTILAGVQELAADVEIIRGAELW